MILNIYLIFPSNVAVDACKIINSSIQFCYRATRNSTLPQGSHNSQWHSDSPKSNYLCRDINQICHCAINLERLKSKFCISMENHVENLRLIAILSLWNGAQYPVSVRPAWWIYHASIASVYYCAWEPPCLSDMIAFILRIIISFTIIHAQCTKSSP